ncbi:SRPBCC family protein [Arthrobacter oryzae]|uniref:SRPBCC family protein n=1 Tax=Arthrobacter oryzae TaxID=409290 RepID=UPI002855080D|nr:SRPBCC family protein [Arthrobacter oryzae]MDR6505184.1 hypothetical protein [Arthrobacter oryzae]
MTLHPSSLAGAAFGVVFRLLKTVRPERPIHPRGVSLRGVVQTGYPAEKEHVSSEESGIGWIDNPGRYTVLARFSRSLGLPAPFPDVLGLALRLPDGGRPADLLFATTGLSVPGRFLLLPHRNLSRAAFTTLFPYRGARGPVLLALKTVRTPEGARSAVTEGQLERSLSGGEWVLALSFANPGGSWRRFGTVTLEAEPGPRDTESRFDPIRNVLPGAETYAWTRRLRERSYAVAQSRVTQSRVAQSGVPKKKARTEMATVSKVFLTPPADVWKVIADGWLYSGWVVGASRIRDVDALWPAADAVLHHSVGAWPLLINDKTTVKASDPEKSIELIARGWPLGEAKVVVTLEPAETGCKVSIAEDAIKGPGLLIPKFIRDPLISVRNTETLNRLELMASGGAGN